LAQVVGGEKCLNQDTGYEVRKFQGWDLGRGVRTTSRRIGKILGNPARFHCERGKGGGAKTVFGLREMLGAGNVWTVKSGKRGYAPRTKTRRGVGAQE